MTTYREDGRFTVRIDLSAEFGEDYDGEDDGNAWLEEWKAVTRPRVVAAIFEALRVDGKFEVVAAPRGASPDEAVEISAKLRTTGKGRSA